MTSNLDYITDAARVLLGEGELDQLTAATVIADCLNERVLWHDGLKRWYFIDAASGIWRPTPTETMLQRDVDEILMVFAASSKRTDAFSSAVTRAISRHLATPTSTFDSDPWVLGAQNGTIDLRTGLIDVADRSWYLTRQAPVEYDQDARCDLWHAHLRRLFEEDDDRVDWFQQAVGASLVGRSDEKDQIFVYLLGPPGNGKGTTMRALVSMLGQDQYAANLNPADLVKDRHLAWMHRLRGTRLAVVEEVKNARLDVSKLKTLTGADTLVANRMRQDDETWEPTHTFFMTANHAPILDDVSGMARRYRPIQTGASVETSELSTAYEESIKAERAGILAWAVRGCLLWQANGQRLEQLTTTADLAAEHLADNDPFLEWSEQCVSVEPDGWTSRSQAISSYNWWAAGRALPNLAPVAQRQLYEWLRARGGRDDRRAQGRGFSTITVYIGTE